MEDNLLCNDKIFVIAFVKFVVVYRIFGFLYSFSWFCLVLVGSELNNCMWSFYLVIMRCFMVLISVYELNVINERKWKDLVCLCVLFVWLSYLCI